MSTHRLRFNQDDNHHNASSDHQWSLSPRLKRTVYTKMVMTTLMTMMMMMLLTTRVVDKNAGDYDDDDDEIGDKSEDQHQDAS